MVVDLWNVQDLADMALYPCAFLTMWDVSADGRLNCMLVQRSGDMGLGVPFNMAQYAALVCMIAQVSGLRPAFSPTSSTTPMLTKTIRNSFSSSPAAGLRCAEARPEFDIKNFYDFKPEDIVLKNYKHHDKIAMEVSV